MDLAKELNDALFGIGSEPDNECARIAFKGSRDKDGNEVDLGGMCKTSMERWFREVLDTLLWDKNHLTQFEDSGEVCEQESSQLTTEQEESK